MAETEAIVYCNRHADSSIKTDVEIGLGDGVGMDWVDVGRYGQVSGCCECGNDPTGSLKCGESLH